MYSIAVIGFWPDAQELTQSLHPIENSVMRLFFQDPGRHIRGDVALVSETKLDSFIDGRYPHSIPVITVTRDPRRGSALLSSGADAVIASPVDSAELLSAAFALLTPGRYFSRRVVAGLMSEAMSRHGRTREPLSKRETEVICELAAGRSDAEIGAALFVSLGTVQTHILNLRRKLGARNRTHAVVIAIEYGLIPPHVPCFDEG